MTTDSKTRRTGAAVAIALVVATLPGAKAQAYCWDSYASAVRSDWAAKVYDTGDWYYMDLEGKVPGVGWECTVARRKSLMSWYGIDDGEWSSFGYEAGVCDFTTPLTRTIDTLEMLETTIGSSADLALLRDLVRGQYGDGNLNAYCDAGIAVTICYPVWANQTDLHRGFFYTEDIVERAAALVHEAAHKQSGWELDFSCGRSHTGDCSDACDIAYNYDGAYSWSADYYRSYCQAAVNTTTALRYRALSWYNDHLDQRFQRTTNGYTDLTTCGQSNNLRDKLHGFWPMNTTSASGAAPHQADVVGGRSLQQASPFNQFSTAVDGNTGPIGAHTAKHSAQKFAFQSGDGLSTVDAYDLSGPFTIATWVRFDPGFWGLNEPGALVAKWVEKAGGRSFLLRYLVDYNAGVSKLRVNLSSNGNDSLFADVAFTPVQGTWYQIVVQWADNVSPTDGKSVLRVTINNQVDQTFTFPSDRVHNASSPLTVAHRPDANTLLHVDPWVGSVDSLGIWKRSLSTTERAELYNNHVGREAGQVYDTPAWWQF